MTQEIDNTVEFHKVLSQHNFKCKQVNCNNRLTWVWNDGFNDELSVIESADEFYFRYDPTVMLGDGAGDTIFFSKNKETLSPKDLYQSLGTLKVWCTIFHNKLDELYESINGMKEWAENEKK